MPKGKRKDKDRKGGGNKHAIATTHPSDEDLSDETMSVLSTQSDGSLALGFDLPEPGGDEVDESSAQENFEEKVKDVIDGLTQKSAKGRLESVKSLRAALAKKVMMDFVNGRQMTIADGIEKCLKKGKGEEQGNAALCYVLLMLQLGYGTDTEELYKTVYPMLITVMLDTSASLKARAACAEALGMCTFIGASEQEHLDNAMRNLDRVFKGSYLKGDGSTPNHSPEVTALHTSALNAWSVLLTIAPPSIVNSVINSELPMLPQLLQSSDVELRIAAGETIALLYELARDEDRDYCGSNIDELITMLKLLATDGNKYRAKKDRRQQRSSFRDILKTVEDAEPPLHQFKFGKECLYLESWSEKRKYDSLCHILCSGTNTHLQENYIVREFFGLGAPQPVGAKPVHKYTKVERTLYNAAAFKARTKARSKHRDKRSAVIGGDS